MANITHFDEYDGVWVWTKFYDLDDALRDPTNVFVVASRMVDGSPVQQVSYEYGTDDELERVSIGYYRANLGVVATGEWKYRWYTTEAGSPSSKEGTFYVHGVEGT